MTDFSVIITAGGIGKRMGGDLPKQFIEVAGKPVLLHTISLFHDFNPEMQIIVTLPEEWFSQWEKLIKDYQFAVPHEVVSGGLERFHSIKNALDFCEGSYILVHDGVRPLVSSDTIDACIRGLRSSDAVIPVVSVKESLRQVNGNSSNAVNRAEFRIVQTPQCFKREVLIKAYEQPFHDAITDDASLVEESGVTITCVDGNPENIKITSPADLFLAESLLKIP